MDESDDAPVESAVSIMPNLDIEIEIETVAPAAEQELSTDTCLQMMSTQTAIKQLCRRHSAAINI